MAAGAMLLTAAPAHAGEKAPTAKASESAGTITAQFARPPSGLFKMVGHGFGHGRGMSQYGARGAAKLGKGYRTILRFYYPGTKLTTAGKTRDLRVRLSHDGSPLEVRAERGLKLHWTAQNRKVASRTLPARVAGCSVGAWRVRRVGNDLAVDARVCKKWRTFLSTKRIWGAGRVSFVPSDGAFALKRRKGGTKRREYHGALRATIRSGRLRAINYVPYEKYLRSVVPSESPASWPQESLRAQSVAARTYAMRSARNRSGSYFDVYDTTSSQVYTGWRSLNKSWKVINTFEDRRTNKAIKATSKKILAYKGKPALTEFGSSNGGWTAKGDYPYAKARRDPWDRVVNPYKDWRRKVSVRRLERRYPSIGRLRAIKLVSRSGHGQWGGRVLKLVIVGSKGKRTISGQGSVSSVLGLKSAWFTVRR